MVHVLLLNCRGKSCSPPGTEPCGALHKAEGCSFNTKSQKESRTKLTTQKKHAFCLFKGYIDSIVVVNNFDPSRLVSLDGQLPCLSLTPP